MKQQYWERREVKFSTEQILKVFKLYEEGATIETCIRTLGCTRKVFRMYLLGNSRIECRSSHLSVYPTGRVYSYKCSKEALFLLKPQ